MIITIAGKAGSGKTTLAETITKNFPHAIHVDLDEVNTQLLTTKEVRVQALSIFGKSVFKDGILDKDSIANHIYNNKELYDDWCNYMKALCEENVLQTIEKNPKSLYIIEHVLINQLSLFKKSACNILVWLNEDERLKRVMKRDNMTLEQVKNREQFLVPYDEKIFNIVFNENEKVDILSKLTMLI